MRRYLSAAAAAEQKSINTRFTVRLFPVAVGKINGLERISRHLPKDQFVWISKTLRVAEDDAKNMQDSQVKASKFVIWMHDKAAQGNTMIQDFADSTVDKSKVAAWKFHIGSVLRNLLSKITLEEKMLRKLPHRSQISKVQLCIDESSSSGQAALENLKSLLISNEKFHQKWVYLNLCAAPFTAAAGVLPGPNVFFFWNMMRLYSHYQALQSSKFLSELHTSNSIELTNATNLEQFLSQNLRTIPEIEEFLKSDLGVNADDEKEI